MNKRKEYPAKGRMIWIYNNDCYISYINITCNLVVKKKRYAGLKKEQETTLFQFISSPKILLIFSN